MFVLGKPFQLSVISARNSEAIQVNGLFQNETKNYNFTKGNNGK
jgi:hypothetical protein